MNVTLVCAEGLQLAIKLAATMNLSRRVDVDLVTGKTRVVATIDQQIGSLVVDRPGKNALVTTVSGAYSVRVSDGQTTLVTPDPFRWAAYAN